MLLEYSLSLPEMLGYAERWAYERNPMFYNFDLIGGDCTNFVSQCLYAGGAVMNPTPDTGWYYYSIEDRAPAWTGVEFFYDFMVGNQGVGPFGIAVPIEEVQVGDILQLGNAEQFYHSLFVVEIRSGVPYVAAHSKDVYQMPLFAYIYEKIRCLRVRQARREILVR